MAIYGTYRCEDCDTTFKGWRENEGPYPDCPHCGEAGGWAPQAPNRIGIKAKAIDIAQRVAEESFGMTNMRDNQRAGDIAALPPSPIQTAEADAITREMVGAGFGTPEVAPHLQEYVKNFFGATSAGGGMTVDPMASIQGAAPAAQAARTQGADPIALLHSAKGHGVGIENLNVVGRSKGAGDEVAI